MLDDLQEAHGGVVDQVARTVERAAQADVGAVVREQEPFLPGPAERGAVGEALAEVGVPGVEVGVEVDQGQRAVPLAPWPAAAAARWCGRRRRPPCGPRRPAGRRPPLRSGPPPPRCRRASRRCRRHRPPGPARRAGCRARGGTGAAGASPGAPRWGRSGRPAGSWCRRRRARRPGRGPSARPGPAWGGGRRWSGRRSAAPRWRRPGRPAAAGAALSHQWPGTPGRAAGPGRGRPSTGRAGS